MADVRSMLRAERQSRRITHPHASYTSSGLLSCNVCDVPVKDKAWGAHLHSTQHTTKLNEQRDSFNSDPNPSKKRKAVDFEEAEDTELKRQKQELEEEEDEAETTVLIHDTEDSVVEEEDAAVQLAALQNDLAALEEASRAERITALNAPATISAAAVSAKDQAEEESKQGGTRDAEGDREDAVRALEDEFDEMDNLQERVRLLKERREALRQPSKKALNDEPVTISNDASVARGIPDRTVSNGESVEEDDESDSDNDDWAFGAR